jgi:hypothetical protein
MPDEPCAFSGTGPDGYHVARFARAERNGLITAADFDVAVVTAGAFGARTVIYDTEGTAMTITQKPSPKRRCTPRLRWRSDRH